MYRKIQLMTTLLCDPLGREIHVPTALEEKNCSCNYRDLEQIITRPSFVIEEKKKALYFFKMLHSRLNMLIEIRIREGRFVVDECIKNPTAEYISVLLKKGGLLGFN